MKSLDSDLLRTFIAVAQTGSVTHGAEKIHRSQSAASIQIKRLETIIGQPVLQRHGRGVVLTDAGKRLLPVAMDVTARLDEALAGLSTGPVEGKIKLGIPHDHGQEKLARIIGDFSRQQPLVELDVTCALSTGFPDALGKGTLDLAIYEVETISTGEELLVEDPTCWVSSAERSFSDAATLPVALFDHACWWRDAAIASLAAQAKPYRIAYSSQSVSGVLAAVEAGIAIGLIGRSSLHRGLVVAGNEYGLGPTPTSKLVLGKKVSEVHQAVSVMASAIHAAFRN